MHDLVCRLGPHDPAVENAFPAYRVAAVVSGSFQFRSSLGDGVPVAGSLLIGNATQAYHCVHVTSSGDRCICFDFDADFLEQVRRDLGVRGAGERFRRALVPPSPRSMVMTAVIDAVLATDRPEALSEVAYDMAAAGLSATHDIDARGRRPSLSDESKIVLAAQYIEAHSDKPCTLTTLAADAGLSPYHFLRVFRRTTGQTPHRYVLATRLRRAAERLRSSHDRILEVAVDSGFGDLSNFNANFARAFGMTPSVYRARYA